MNFIQSKRFASLPFFCTFFSQPQIYTTTVGPTSWIFINILYWCAVLNDPSRPCGNYLLLRKTNIQKRLKDIQKDKRNNS